MAERRCPLCNQSLPETLTQIQIDSQFQKLATRAFDEKRKQLQGEFQGRLDAERKLAHRRAEKNLHREISQANKRADDAESGVAKRISKQAAEFDQKLRLEKERSKREARGESRREIKIAQKRAKDAEEEAKKQIDRAEKQVERRVREERSQAERTFREDNELKIEKLQAVREKENLRHETETVKLRGQLDDVCRKLEKRSGEQFGEEGELDLIAELTRAFPKDRIERIGRGTKGADIVHYVVDDGKTVGQIIYENKSVKVTGWSNGFISQADKYRTQYETPYIMIVSRAFPRKERDFCVARGIPVVCLRMASALASVMREAIVVIGRLRLSGAGRDQKAQELLGYVLSDRFATRFRAITDGVSALREQQRKERNWHENSWETQSSMHDRIDKSHREIGAQVETVLRAKRPMAMAVRA